MYQIQFDNSKHALAECPRCGKTHACKANAPHKCECVKVNLTQNEIIFIKQEMLDEPDCICMNCLDDLKHLYKMKTQD